MIDQNYLQSLTMNGELTPSSNVVTGNNNGVLNPRVNGYQVDPEIERMRAQLIAEVNQTGTQSAAQPTMPKSKQPGFLDGIIGTAGNIFNGIGGAVGLGGITQGISNLGQGAMEWGSQNPAAAQGLLTAGLGMTNGMTGMQAFGAGGQMARNVNQQEETKYNTAMDQRIKLAALSKAGETTNMENQKTLAQLASSYGVKPQDMQAWIAEYARNKGQIPNYTPSGKNLLGMPKGAKISTPNMGG